MEKRYTTMRSFRWSVKNVLREVRTENVIYIFTRHGTKTYAFLPYEEYDRLEKLEAEYVKGKVNTEKKYAKIWDLRHYLAAELRDVKNNKVIYIFTRYGEETYALLLYEKYDRLEKLEAEIESKKRGSDAKDG